MKILGVCGAQGALLYKLRNFLIGNVEPRSVFHTPLEEQWKLNFGNIPFVKDIDSLDLKNRDLDFIIGSPSCGHSSVFSYSRKKSLGEPKEDETLNMYINSVKSIKPECFIMENLPKLIDLIPLNEWRKTLPEYDIITHCHSVDRFGNSQITRKRMLLIGVKKTSSKYHIDMFRQVFKCKKRLSNCRRLAKFIRPELNYCESPTKTVSMYHYSSADKKSLTVSEVEKLWAGEFKEWNRWPMFGHKMNTLPGVYRNQWETYPLTIRPSNRQFDPDGKIMGLEWYRLIMGFSRGYKIHFDSSNPTYWLNKARIAYTKGATFEMGTWVYRLLKRQGLIPKRMPNGPIKSKAQKKPKIIKG